LYDRYPAARRVFERAEEVLEMPVRKLCFDGPVEELNRTDIIQPCVMTVCWAAYEVWREGYGLGDGGGAAGHRRGGSGPQPAGRAHALDGGRRGRVPEGGRQAAAQGAVDPDPGERVRRGAEDRSRAPGGAAPADAAPGRLGADDGFDAGDESSHRGRAGPGSR